MKAVVTDLKNRIESNITEVESYYDSIHMFLSQIKLMNDIELGNMKIRNWLYDNRYTIIILEEILEKIEIKKQLSA